MKHSMQGHQLSSLRILGHTAVDFPFISALAHELGRLSSSPKSMLPRLNGSGHTSGKGSESHLDYRKRVLDSTGELCVFLSHGCICDWQVPTEISSYCKASPRHSTPSPDI